MRDEHWNAGVCVLAGIAFGCLIGLSVAAASEGVQIKDMLGAAAQVFGWLIAVGAAGLAFFASNRNIDNQRRISNLTLLKNERDRVASELPHLRRAKIIIDDIIINFDYVFDDFPSRRREAIDIFVREGGGQHTTNLDEMVRRAIPNVPDALSVQIVDALDFISSPDLRIELDDLGFDPFAMQTRYDEQLKKNQDASIRGIYDLQRRINAEIDSATEVVRDFEYHRIEVISALRKSIRRAIPHDA